MVFLERIFEKFDFEKKSADNKKAWKITQHASSVTVAILIRLSLASFLWDIGKQCRTRSDIAECGVWSGSLLFAQRVYFLNLN